MQAIFNKRLCRLCSLFVAIALVLGLGGCTAAEKQYDYSVPKTKIMASGVAAQNENYTLRWDSEQYTLLLEDNNSGYIWSSVPYDFYLTGEDNVNLSSPLFIEYYSPEDGSLQSSKAYSDCMQEGNFSVEAIDNGVRMTFWFLDAEATIALDFTLRENSLAVSVPFEKIEESGRTKLISVSVMPYFCATPNSTEKSSYLFVPSGSGALMYTDEDIQNVSRSFVGEVYGKDAACVYLDNPLDETALTMPVYGVTANENSLMAIIEQGDGFAKINAEAGNFRNGYSTAYSTIVLRGSDETEAERNNYSDEEVYAESFDKTAVYTVGFYPLAGENSGYNGMAKRYKKYLSDNGLLVKGDTKRADYHINILGGAMTKKFILGFPYHSLTAATTFNQANDIIAELLKEVGSAPAVTLTGFGKTGVDAGNIAGGYAFASDLGGKKGYIALEEYCKKNNIDLFVDFDAVYFNSSGNGVQKRFDTAKTPGRQAAAFYPRTVSTRIEDESYSKVRLLKRSMLNEVTDKIIDFTDDFSAGISLATLSNVAYSDYSSPEYYSKGEISKQAAELIAKVRKGGHTVAGSSANSYAAAVCDTVYDTPLDNGGYLNLDCTVPFYSLVFGESTALYSSALNLSENSEELILRAIEAGASPSFTLINEYDEKLSDSTYFDFYGTDFEGQKNDVKDTLKRVSVCFDKISGQYAVEHEIIDTGVTKTVFSSGATVFVNYNKTEVTVGDILISAMDFVCVE